MADFKSFLKSAVSSAVNSSSESSEGSELDLSKVTSIIESIMGSKSLLEVIFHAAAAAKSLQLCPTLCNTIDSSPPGSPVPGILQARILE